MEFSSMESPSDQSDVLRLAEISASSRYPDDLPPIEMAEVERFAEAAQNIVAHARHILKIGEGRTRDAGDPASE